MKKVWFVLAILVIIGTIGCSFIFVYQKNDVHENDDVPVMEEEPQKEIQTAKLTLVGDLLFETMYYNTINAGEDKDLYFSLVKDYFLNDDLSVGNMEVVIGSKDMPVKGGDNYNFAAPP